MEKNHRGIRNQKLGKVNKFRYWSSENILNKDQIPVVVWVDSTPPPGPYRVKSILFLTIRKITQINKKVVHNIPPIRTKKDFMRLFTPAKFWFDERRIEY